MKPDPTETLCTRCGLCCDGSLFADAELSGRAEATRFEILGLRIEDDDERGGLLLQPCAALRGTRCSIYAHRPKCCRTFECRLLQDVRRGAVSEVRARTTIAASLKLVRKARALLVRLGQRGAQLPLGERAAEALTADTGADRAATARRAQLARTMSSLDGLLRRSFLGTNGR